MKVLLFIILFYLPQHNQTNLQLSGTESNLQTGEIDRYAAACDSKINYVLYQETPLTPADEESLQYLYESLLMVGEIFRNSYEKWGIPEFNDASRKEFSSLDTIRTIMDKYKLKNPAVNHHPGIYFNPEIQLWHNENLSNAITSYDDALSTALRIEEKILYDIQQHSTKGTQNNDLRILYTKLYTGAANHLKRFYPLLMNRGSSYSPEYLSQAEFEKLLVE